MKPNPRLIAVQILNDVERKRMFAEPLLNTYLENATLNNDHDTRLLTLLVYGTLRMRNHLDWIIGHMYAKKVETMETGIKNILRISLYQLLFTSRIPDYAIVNEAVRLTRKYYPGRTALINAILRNTLRKQKSIPFPDPEIEPLDHIAVFHSHPKWLVEMWSKQLGIEETRNLCESNNVIPPFAIRVNDLLSTKEDIIRHCDHYNIQTIRSHCAPSALLLSGSTMSVRNMEAFKNGHFLIQDEASQLISGLVNPQPGEKILDVCAGAGIKTTHMGQMMRNSGGIVALDLKTEKIDELNRLARQLGLSIITAKVGNALEGLGKQCFETFDKILCDVPCSGLGTLRRNPEIKWNTAADKIAKNPPLQLAILTRSACYLKPGGRMVYSTCTLNKAENEDVVRAFLESHPDFYRTSPPPLLDTTMIGNDGFFKTYPHRHGTDGFFGAIVQKRKGLSK